MDFVDREKELERIEKDIGSDTSELVVVYGRRRIGKSELVKQSLDEDVVYFQATEGTPEIQLDDFIESVAQIYPGVENIRKDWEAVLEFLAEKDATVAIDEFPYLIESDSTVPSVFQRFWDNQDSRINLVLIGSSISVMNEKVMSGGSPLHSRWTERIDLRPLSFENSAKFFPKYSSEEKVEAWSVFGGTPHYLKSIEPEKSFRENVEDLLLSEQGSFRDEPEFLLRSELSQPHRYMAALKAIAAGNTSRNEIAQASGIENSSIGSYLSKLENLRLIEREVPVTEDPPRSRSGRYKIKEPLVKFWFRFIYGNEDQIGLTDDPLQDIVSPGLNDYVSSFFEELCIQKLPELFESKFTGVGRRWYNEDEIDVVGLREEGKVLGECKYTTSEIGMPVLAKLEGKEEKLRVEGDTDYVLFSKSGFKQGLKEEERKREDLYLFSLKDLVN
jgi:AAA+ ATPase superfamily predicted ATPase